MIRAVHEAKKTYDDNALVLAVVAELEARHEKMPLAATTPEAVLADLVRSHDPRRPRGQEDLRRQRLGARRGRRARGQAREDAARRNHPRGRPGRPRQIS